MNKRALQTVCDFNMLSKGDTVLAAVSGGADSVALLRFLLEVKEEYCLNLAVCHVNHLLRGEDAERDESFVENLCREHSVPFYLKRCDVSSLAKEKGIGFEECGRDVRYSFFSETAASLGENVKIATAHNLGDLCETLIFNIARGTSPKGICSILPVRDNIIRPLIYCGREQIEEYLSYLGQDFCVDKTNFDTDYSRNFIRHQIIPLMKKINPSFDIAAQNLSSLALERQELFDEICDSEYKKVYNGKSLDKNLLSNLNIAVKRGIITRFLRENNVTVQKKLCDDILSLLEEECFCLSVCKNGYLVLKGGKLSFEIREKEEKIPYEFPFSFGSHTLASGNILEISEITSEEFRDIKQNHPHLLTRCVNGDRLDSSFIIRNRKDGDKITIFPRKVTKTLKKLLNESKLNAKERDIIPIIAKGDTVHFVYDIGVDSFLAASENCSKIAFLSLKTKKTESKK